MRKVLDISMDMKEENNYINYYTSYDGKASLDDVDTYIDEISKIPLLSKEEERELTKSVKNGSEEARKLLITSNLRLVVSFAKKYQNHGLSLLDLIQEGNMGLIYATYKYDVESDAKFSTYAANWIKQRILRAVADKGRNIRIPSYLHDKVITYRKDYRKLELELKRTPTNQELADYMSLSLEAIRYLDFLTIDTYSINEMVKDDEAQEMEIFITNDGSSLEESVEKAGLRVELMKVLDNVLSPREKEIVIRRSGLLGRVETLAEVSERLNITGERVRQIEKDAFNKIRNSEAIKGLCIYADRPDKSLEYIEEFQIEYQHQKELTKLKRRLAHKK